MSFRIDASNLSTVNITDFQMVNRNVAKVVVATSGAVDSDTMRARLVDQLRGLGAPIRASFRKIKGNEVSAAYVGFVRSTPEVREVTSNELRASYRAVLASNENVLMNTQDQSVWQIKTGAGGKYLVRQGDDNLQDLIASATNHYTPTPRLSSVSMQVPSKNSLVAFVTPEGDLEHGFVLRSSTKDQVAEVITPHRASTTIVPTSLMAGAYEIEIDPEIHALVAANISKEAKDQQREYYTVLFRYAPEYRDKILQMVDEQGNS